MDHAESLRVELENRYAAEMEQTAYQHSQQLQAARMELDRSIELAKQKASRIHKCFKSVYNLCKSLSFARFIYYFSLVFQHVRW